MQDNDLIQATQQCDQLCAAIRDGHPQSVQEGRDILRTIVRCAPRAWLAALVSKAHELAAEQRAERAKP